MSHPEPNERPAPAITPLEENIPLDQAWIQGRRVYIRCGYHSRLNTELRAINAHWDGDERALWVGTGKRDQALKLVTAHRERAARARATKDLGLWVTIPRGAAEVRKIAHEKGCVFDADQARWAAPTPQVQAEVEQAIADHHQRKKDEQDRKRHQRAQDKKAAAELAAMSPAQLAERAGRTLTGQTIELRGASGRRMRRSSAERLLDGIGQLVELGDGRHGIVVEHRTWFVSQELGSSCWHDAIGDAAHWDLWHRVAVVENTPEEEAEEHQRRARAHDARALRLFLEDLARTQAPTREGYSQLEDDDHVGTIEVSYGSWGRPHQSGGRALLLTDRILYRHPGYYDDYRATERTITDQDLLTRMRALLAAGGRERTWTDQLEYRCTVTLTDRQE